MIPKAISHSQNERGGISFRVTGRHCATRRTKTAREKKPVKVVAPLNWAAKLFCFLVPSGGAAGEKREWEKALRRFPQPLKAYRWGDLYVGAEALTRKGFLQGPFVASGQAEAQVESRLLRGSPSRLMMN